MLISVKNIRKEFNISDTCQDRIFERLNLLHFHCVIDWMFDEN